MNTETLLYGTKPNEVLEDLLYIHKGSITAAHAEALKAKAVELGYTKPRIAVHTGYEKPDFIGAIN